MYARMGLIEAGKLNSCSLFPVLKHKYEMPESFSTALYYVSIIVAARGPVLTQPVPSFPSTLLLFETISDDHLLIDKNLLLPSSAAADAAFMGHLCVLSTLCYI